MIKKKGAKKRIIITLMVVLLALAVPFAVVYHNYTKEICVMEPVEHMEQREGVNMDGILIKITYSVMTNGEKVGNCLYVSENGEKVENCLYVFGNGDVYSGYYIDYLNRGSNGNQEQSERMQEQSEMIEFFQRMDNRYWDYLYDQCYWGRLSPRDLNGVINELVQAEFVPYHEPIDARPVPATSIGTRKGIQTGTQMGTQMESFAERTFDLQNNDFYYGHEYMGRMECEGKEGLECISWGSAYGMYMYLDNEHAHNAIDIIKSTWAYEQWTNQIFGEGWEERIDLKDELEEDKF